MYTILCLFLSVERELSSYTEAKGSLEWLRWLRAIRKELASIGGHKVEIFLIGQYLKIKV